MKRIFLLCAPLLIMAIFSAAADVPPPGVSLAVPGALAGASFAEPSFLFGEDPRAAAWNPAAASDRELPVFGVAADLAFPAGAGAGAGGRAVLSASIPTSFGTGWVIADGVIAGDSLRSWAAPSGASFAAGLSKRVADRLAVGLGAGAATADIEGRGWTMGVSLGAELSFPDIAPAGSDLSFALLALGPALGDGPARDPLIAATPIVAWRSRFVENEKFSLSVGALLAAPSASDLAIAAGATFSIGRYLGLGLGWRWSAQEAAAWAEDGMDADEYAFRTFPAISVTFSGSSLVRLGDYGTVLAGSVRPAGSGTAVVSPSAVFSRGQRDTQGPEVSVELGSKSPYSPRLVDSLTFPLDIRDASRIVEWKAMVYGPDGAPVFDIGDSLAATGPQGILRGLAARKRSVKAPTAFTVPVSAVSADGEYRIRAWARDEHGNVGNATERSFSMDGSAPIAEARVEGSAVFTPNGDGLRDTLRIVQEGDAEALWTGTFRSSAGTIVRTLRWTDGPPGSFAWDGRTDTGESVSDGTYEYTLESTDGAGNHGSARIAGIVVDAESTPLGLSLDGRALSTDRDATITSVSLGIRAPRARGLASWTISVVGEGEKPLRTWAGSAERLDVLPTTIRFDGRSRTGDPIPDGRYRFIVDLTYTNGNTPQATSPAFVVDSKKPSGRLRASAAVLIPDRGDRVRLFHTLSAGAKWQGVIRNERDEVVLSILLGEETEGVTEWNGLDAEGRPVPDGRYRYVAEGVSAVGLSGSTQPVSIRLESAPFAATVVADRAVFSAKAGDGRVRFRLKTERGDRVVSYRLEVRNTASRSVVRQFEGIAVLPAALAWDGRDEFGSVAPDGDYVAGLSVLFDGGARVSAESAAFSLDSTPPRAVVGLGQSVFSPNGDGVLDTVLVTQRGAEGSGLWTGAVLDGRGEIIRTYSWKGLPSETFSWNGRDEDGALFVDGDYRYRLSSVDPAGNAFSAETPIFRLDARIPSGTLAVDKRSFSPNGDGFADSLLVRLGTAFVDGLASWSVDIVDASGKAAHRLADSGAPSPRSSPPAEIRWQGNVAEGTRAADGTYRAVAELRYAKGDLLRLESAPFLIDTTPPAVTTEFKPLPFSPDGDGEADELFISIRAKDASDIAGWVLTILDPAGYPFTTFTGKSLPDGPFAWDGSDLQGQLVEAAQDYSYELIVRDALANVWKGSGSLPVDVFVLRDGDRLKIRVSSIEFAPSSAALSSGDPKTVAKNEAVLDRIATVLSRFPTYRIRVEGHAVNLSGTEREERTELAELSLSRARTVLEALAARGVDRSRLEARGLGGREPIVPHGDTAGRWRNRRVEFILVR